jgi:MFS family permease
LGDELALIALTIRVADLTDSGLAVSGFLLAGLLPLVLFAPLAGLIVDRYENTHVLALASLAQAYLAVALAVTTSLPTILILAFLLGAGAAVSQPAALALTPAAVGDARVTEANAYLETARYVGAIAGPLIAGGLAAGFNTRVALLVDSITFLAIAGAALSLRVRRAPAREGSARTRGEARAGFTYLRRDRVLLLAVGVIALMVLFAAMDNVAEVFFAREVLDAGNWGYGALAAAWILGMVGGATLIARRLPNERLAPAAIVAAIVGGAAVATAALVHVVSLAVAMFFIGGVANGVENVSMRSLIAHRVPDRLRGRVFASYFGLATAMQLGATAAGGGLLELIGRPETVLLVGGLGSAIVATLGLLWYLSLSVGARELPTEVPESADGGSPGSGPVVVPDILPVTAGFVMTPAEAAGEVLRTDVRGAEVRTEEADATRSRS